jgi:hypothetical protein
MAKESQNRLTLDEAYQAAFLWFDHKGEPPLEISEPAHGSIELTTETTLARVRMGDTPADQSSVLALLRVDPGDKRLAIFSTSGFTPGAISVAETQGIALYEFDQTGAALAKTTHARSLAPETAPEPPFRQSEPESVLDRWGDQQLPGQKAATSPPPMPADVSATKPMTIEVEDDEWSECPTCGTTHFKNARFCRSCGTDLVTGIPHGRALTTEGHTLICHTCGSFDIGVDPDPAADLVEGT